MNFRCVAMDSSTAARFRATKHDDRGASVMPIVATNDTGFICRHCLAQPGTGSEVLLGSYDIAEPSGFFWSPSPIFVHSTECARYNTLNEVPKAVSGIELVGVRPYDSQNFLLYDLNDVAAGERVHDLITRAFQDPRTEYINLHTGKPGCFLCRVERP